MCSSDLQEIGALAIRSMIDGVTCPPERTGKLLCQRCLILDDQHSHNFSSTKETKPDLNGG